jgi:nucleotide-binding universal stress UspA family protein
LYRRIVVGYDGSDGARDALALAELLRGAGGAVIVACVHPMARFPHGAEWESAARARAREIADEVVGRLGDSADWREPRAVPGKSPAQGLHDLAEERGADLVVVGSSHNARHGRTRAGGVGERLLNGSPCPVAVAPKGFREETGEPRVVGLAVDGSAEAEFAMREGAALARSYEAAVRLLCVVPTTEHWVSPPARAARDPQELERYQRQALREMLDDLARRLPVELRAEPRLLEGRASAALIDEAERGVHLLVMGSRGYGPFARTLLGATAVEVLGDAPCPVLVVPRGAAAPNATGQTDAKNLDPVVGDYR